MNQAKWAMIFIFLFAFSITSCSRDNRSSGNLTQEGQLPSSPEVGKVQAFSSESDLESYLLKQFAQSPLPEDAYDSPLAIGPPDSSGASTEDAAGASPVAAGSRFSETNIQEQGVDESDKVKTDGKYFYIAQGDRVQIILAEASKAQPSVKRMPLATIKIDGLVDSLYLKKHLLLILYTPTDGGGRPWLFDDREISLPQVSLIGMPFWIPIHSKTGLLIVDISNPAAPKRIKQTLLDGQLSSSRLVAGKLHLILQFFPSLPRLQIAYRTSEETFEAVVEKNKRLLDPLTLKDLLPHYKVLGHTGDVLESGLLLDWDSFYRPSDEGGGSIVTVVSFDLFDPSIPFTAVGIVADVHTLYASTTALYLTATQWKGRPFLDDEPRAEQQDPSQITMIHKLDISGDKVIPVASGAVWGRILNPFSLGEHKNILRIATTTGFSGRGRRSQNHLFTLQEEAGKLSILGKIENIAPGEEIYAARFIGDRGFLVTFVRVDPLFTIDLSDPAQPRIAGILKVPGYSDYIHPLGEDYLITIGKASKEEGGVAWYQGMQLSIFDVSDFSDPVRVHKASIGDRGTESEALHNHKAFTFWAEKGLLAIPLRLHQFTTPPQSPWERGDEVFRGLYVYHVTSDSGFKFLGRIKAVPPIKPLFFNDWTRGIFIGDTIYAVKSHSITGKNLQDFLAHDFSSPISAEKM